MKKIKSIKILFSIVTFSLLSLLLIISCTNDDSSKAQPLRIESVSKSAIYMAEAGIPERVIDSVTTLGFAGETFIIRGSGFKTLNKVYFNDLDTYFSPNFVTDKAIFVTINRLTPYINVSNKLKLVLKNGESVEADFVVGPPAPRITSFNSINAVAGEVVTISGSFFLNPIVTFGTTLATIQSSTLTEIKVIVPANSNFKYITVKTISGASTTKEAMGTAIYDDSRASFVENYLGPWDNSGFTVNTTEKIQGNSSIEANFGGFVGFKFPMFASPVATSPYKAIRVSFKSQRPVGKFLVVLNGNFGGGKQISFDNSQWTTVDIQFTDLIGTVPATINEIVFQEFAGGGAGAINYIDNVGFVLK